MRKLAFKLGLSLLTAPLFSDPGIMLDVDMIIENIYEMDDFTGEMDNDGNGGYIG